jgi:hypothetical protein
MLGAAVHANNDLHAGATERCSGTARPVVHAIVFLFRY